MKKLNVAQMQFELTKAKASDIGTLAEAKRNINKAGENLTASACIVHITDYSGKPICGQFAVHDGLSAETIKALQADIEKTISLRLKLAGLSK